MIITLFHYLRLNSNVFYWLLLLFLEMHGLKESGITKHITFHCFRHTYASLQMELGADIYGSSDKCVVFLMHC